MGLYALTNMQITYISNNHVKVISIAWNDKAVKLIQNTKSKNNTIVKPN